MLNSEHAKVVSVSVHRMKHDKTLKHPKDCHIEDGAELFKVFPMIGQETI